MSLIYLIQTPESLQIAPQGKTLCVYHHNYRPPASIPYTMPFATFTQSPREALSGVEMLIVVGITQIITPANRTDLVFEVLYNNTPSLRKISIDRLLFISDPWRAWFHFGLVGAPYREYTYSYLAESHYSAYVERLREEDPFSCEEIEKWGHGVIQCIDPFLFQKIEVETISLSSTVHHEYADFKEQVFAEEKSIKGILRRLGAFASEHCQQRYIPAKHQLFRSPTHHIVRTDLKVDEYFTNELLHRVKLTNVIARSFLA